MDADTKIILAKTPIVIICVALLFVNFSSGDEPVQGFTWGLGQYLHLLVILDLALKNKTFSKCYYSMLTLWMTWEMAHAISCLEAPLLLEFMFFLLPLAPYLWVTFVVWQKTNPGTSQIKTLINPGQEEVLTWTGKMDEP